MIFACLQGDRRAWYPPLLPALFPHISLEYADSSAAELSVSYAFLPSYGKQQGGLMDHMGLLPSAILNEPSYWLPPHAILSHSIQVVSSFAA